MLSDTAANADYKNKRECFYMKYDSGPANCSAFFDGGRVGNIKMVMYANTFQLMLRGIYLNSVWYCFGCRLNHSAAPVMTTNCSIKLNETQINKTEIQ